MTATVRDPLGEIGVKTSSPRRRLLEAFRVCSEHATSMSEAMRRGIADRLIADGGMHLKNLSVLKTANVGDTTFPRVRLAPISDSVTTKIFPQLAEGRMALKLSGKDDRLNRDDFLSLAKTIGISVAKAKRAIERTCNDLNAEVGRVQVPAMGKVSPRITELLSRHHDLIVERCSAMLR